MCIYFYSIETDVYILLYDIYIRQVAVNAWILSLKIDCYGQAKDENRGMS